MKKVPYLSGRNLLFSPGRPGTQATTNLPLKPKRYRRKKAPAWWGWGFAT
jgi:hypothetical protein